MSVVSASVTITILWIAFGGCGGGGASKGAARTSARTHSSVTPSSPTSSGGRPSTERVGPAKETSPGVVRAYANGVSATMRVETHDPRVNRAWPVSFTVSRDGKPVKADVRYQYLFAGQVVARRSHYRFTGRFHDIFMWPASAVGYPLTFRAVIGAAGITLNLDYAVQVQR